MRAFWIGNVHEEPVLSWSDNSLYQVCFYRAICAENVPLPVFLDVCLRVIHLFLNVTLQEKFVEILKYEAAFRHAEITFFCMEVTGIDDVQSSTRPRSMLLSKNALVKFWTNNFRFTSWSLSYTPHIERPFYFVRSLPIWVLCRFTCSSRGT